MNYRYVARSMSHFKVNVVVKILIAENVPGGTIEAAGIAVAIYAVSKSVFEVPVGIFIDKKKGERDDLTASFLGTLLQGVAYFLMIFITNIWQLYLLQAVMGFASAVAFPGWYAIFSRHVDDNKQGFEWSLYDVLIGFGYAGAAAISGFIAVMWGFKTIFIVVAIFTCIGAFLLPIIFPQMKKK